MSRDLFRLHKKFLLDVDMNARLFLEDLSQCKRIIHRNDKLKFIYRTPFLSKDFNRFKIIVLGSRDVNLKCNNSLYC